MQESEICRRTVGVSLTNCWLHADCHPNFVVTGDHGHQVCMIKSQGGNSIDFFWNEKCPENWNENWNRITF